ncbi:MAG: DNA-protecting protein DprA, partial [Desulfovibrio sp.]|nr:DNA-protecting protein DprA [Desulfovibrio sp.]
LAEKGLLLSEFTPGTQPKPKHFPMRNRLISGLSRGLFVAEAAARSGSLITARLALEQGRDVFAAPGHTLDGRAAGCHDLILNGAKAVFSPDHILRELTPLLSHEAVTALERRRLEDIEARKKAPSRTPGLDWHVDDQNRAEALLPKVDLPWLAPEGTARMAARKNAKSVRSAPPSPSATAAPAGPVAQSRKKAGGRPGPAVPKAVPLDPEQARVFAALGREKRHIADLAAALECAEPALSGLLAMLEVKGLARHHPGMFYSLP